MLRALGEYEIGGLVTLVPFHRAILATDQWRKAETCRDLIGDKKWLKSLAPEEPPAPAAEQSEDAEVAERTYRVEVDGRLHSVKVIGAPAANADPGPAAGLRRPPRRERAAGRGRRGRRHRDARLPDPGHRPQGPGEETATRWRTGR